MIKGFYKVSEYKILNLLNISILCIIDLTTVFYVHIDIFKKFKILYLDIFKKSFIL